MNEPTGRRGAGATFAAAGTAEGVVLRPRSPFPETTVEDLIGAAGCRGPRRTAEETEEAVAREQRG